LLDCWLCDQYPPNRLLEKTIEPLHTATNQVGTGHKLLLLLGSC
jgi:hypothetical protein